MIEFELNGRTVAAPIDGISLLEALRDHLGDRSVKDGCSPQGQCGCCTVWVDGNPRVACVTPVGRVRGRRVTTVEGLDDAGTWADRFCEAGASQCGFCTPGIVMRLAALDSGARADPDAVNRALLAHLCRCTGWQPIVEACRATSTPSGAVPVRSLDDAARRAALEGGTSQTVGSGVALGRGGFADDSAPDDALVAMLGADGDWVVAESVREVRRAAGKIQGRRSTAPLTWPIDLRDALHDRDDDGFVARLHTTWVEPAYLEPDASWCAPGADPVTPLANGGAFGGKVTSPVAAAARRLADLHGRPVRVLLTREDTVRIGPKRPPVAGGIRPDGTGLLRITRPAEPADEELLRTGILQVAPGLDVEFVDVVGPPSSAAIRAAGWAEAALLASAADRVMGDAPITVTAPGGGSATARLDDDGAVTVSVRCGTPLDHAVLRSYCTGAAHMALGWIRSEGLAVDEHGVPLDLTIRSFGIIRAVDMPRIDVQVEADDGPPVNGSDAVFAAVAAAAWRAAGRPERIPTRSGRAEADLPLTSPA